MEKSEQTRNPIFPWFTVEKGIQRLRDIKMLEWICQLRPTHSWKCPEDTPFTCENLICEWRLWRVLIALFWRSDLTVGTVVTEFGNLNAMGRIGSEGDRGQVLGLSQQRQGECGYCNGQQSHSSSQHSLTYADWRDWLVDHGASRNEIDRKPTKILPDLYKQKNSSLSEPKSNLNHKNR